MAEWTFFTNHAHVLLCIAREPDIRLRDLAVLVAPPTEQPSGSSPPLAARYLERSRDGRRNRYAVRDELPLRHPVEQPHRVGEVLAVLADAETGGAARTALPAGRAAS